MQVEIDNSSFVSSAQGDSFTTDGTSFTHATMVSQLDFAGGTDGGAEGGEGDDDDDDESSTTAGSGSCDAACNGNPSVDQLKVHRWAAT